MVVGGHSMNDGKDERNCKRDTSNHGMLRDNKVRMVRHKGRGKYQKYVVGTHRH